MHILFVTSCLPYPPVSGGRLQTFLRLRHLKERGHAVYLMTLALPQEYQRIEELRNYITDIGYIYPRTDYSKAKNLLKKSLFYGIFSYDKNFGKALRDYVKKKNIDIALFEDLGVVQYREYIPSVPSVFYKHNIEYEVIEQTVSFLRKYPSKILQGTLDQKMRNTYLYLWGGREKQLVSDLEIRSLERFNLIITCSERDAGVLNRHGAACITIPWSIEQPADSHKPVEKETYTLAFIGSMDWEPNKDAITWFVHEVFPRIRQEVGRVDLVIGGSAMSRDIQRLDNARDIRVMGFITDLPRFLLDADIFIAPLRFGGGVKVKVIEAMAYGLPVVTTTAGALGLTARHGDHLLIGDTVGEFVENIRLLVNNSDMRRSLGLKAREYTAECHNPSKVMKLLEQCLEEVADRRRI